MRPKGRGKMPASECARCERGAAAPLPVRSDHSAANAKSSAQPEGRVIGHIGQRQQPVAEGQRLQFRCGHVGHA